MSDLLLYCIETTVASTVVSGALAIARRCSRVAGGGRGFAKQDPGRESRSFGCCGAY
jgi:hypothetical protein